MPRIFKIPFAAQGDKDEVPVATQGDGSVSITQGFGFDYEREYEDPAAKDIRREVMNGLLHDLSEAIGDIQLSGVAKWSEDAAPYPEGALVWHNDSVWVSRVDNNSAIPVEGSNWSRGLSLVLANATFVPLTRNLTAGDGLTGGGNLSANRSFAVDTTVARYGTGSAQVRTNTQNDARFLLGASNLSDLGNAGTARNNLGLGSMATRDTGTDGAQHRTNAQNDARFLLAASNLSDLGNVATARNNLGLGTAATANTGTGATQVPTTSQADGRYLRQNQNLSDLGNAATARDNLGLGTAATQADTRYAHRANNLSDLGNAATARGNLGLGAAATMDTTASRTSSSTSTLLQAAGMNNHRTSGDHDDRYARRSNNLSDLSNASTARNNLGLGSLARLDNNLTDSGVMTNRAMRNTFAQYTTTGDTSFTSFPIGSVVLVSRDGMNSLPGRNGGRTIYLSSNNSQQFTMDSSSGGAALDGDWRNRGRTSSSSYSNSDQAWLFQRVL